MRSLALATAFLFATSSAGCAMISANAPDANRRADEPPRCNDSKGAVAVDGIMSAALGVGTLAVAGESGGAAAAFAVGALIYGVSAGVGNASANKCRAANDDYMAYREQELDDARRGGAIGGLPRIPEDEEDVGPATARPATPPVVAPPVAATPRPVATPRPPPAAPPRPPVAAPPPDEDDDDGDDDAGAGDDDDGAWSAFWKELP